MADHPDPTQSEATLPQGPGLALTFLYYFSGTALVTTLLAVKTLGVGLDTGIPNQFGLLFGAIGGTLGTIFNRSLTLELPYTSRKRFKANLDQALETMGYTEVSAAGTDHISVYTRSAIRQLFSGRVYVLFGENQATISSRAMHVRRLQRRLR